MVSPDLGPGRQGGFEIGMSSGTDNLTEVPRLTSTLDEQASPLIPEIDPQTLDPEHYQQLDLTTKRSVDLVLLRKGDESSIAKLGELEPGFEMEYPLSPSEDDIFRSFEGYVSGGVAAAGYDAAEWEPEVFEELDLEKKRRQLGLPEPIGRKIEGFKLKRWERWQLEEQVRLEREALENRENLPKAA